MSTPTATNEKQQQQLITMMQAQNRERFYGPIKFNSSGALQPANAMDERMIREKYGEDEEMNELERELLNGEKKNNDKERSKLGDVKSNNQKVVLAGAVVGLGGAVQAVARKANTNSNSTSSDSPSQSRLGKAKHQQQMHSLLLNNNNNNNNNNTNNGSHESTDGGGNNNNNNGTNTSAAAVTAFEKKQDSGSGGSNKISASNESKLLLQNDVDNNDGSDNMKSNNNNREDDNKNNNNNNNNNTSNEESDKSNQQNVDSERNTTITTGNEKMLMIKENETNENAAEMNETDLLCDFDMEKQQIATPRRRKAKSKSTTKNNVLLVGSKRKVTLTNEEKTIEVIEAKKQQQQQQRDLLKRSGKNEGENNSKKKRKANEADNNNCNSEEKNKNSSSEDENDDSDNDNIKCFDNNREQRQQQKRSNDNSRDTSSGDTIIDEEGAKNANLLFGCDNLFVPPVAALFKPKQNAVLHKSGPENLDVNDGTNAKKFGTNGKEMNTINDSLYDQQFQIEPERLSARPGTDDSFRWFDPSSRAVATLGRSGSDEGEQYEPTTTTAMNKRRSNNININDKKATTTTTNNNNNNNKNNKNESDNSSFHEERRRRRSSEEGSDDVDISNELSDEEVYEADYEDKERLIDDLEDDLGENNNNHPVRSKLPYSRNVAGTTTTTTTTLLTNGRRAQRGRPPKNMTLAPPRVAVKKSMKVSAASKNTNSKSTTTSFAKLTTIRAVSKAPDSGEVKRKVKQNAKMFDELGEYTVAKVENGGMMESSKKSSGGSSLKQKSTGDDGAKSNDNKAVGKRNLSSIVGKSGSDNQNKRAAFGVRSGDTTKSVSKSVSSGVSEGFQQQGNNETNAAEGGPRRSKHHNPWSLEEAQALITGVITCGGGKWADIKKLGYREIEHRTAVDLKDKWRNLLRIATLPSAAAPLVRDSASNKSASGDRKREIPRAMLDKVRELALLHAKNKERELKLKGT